MVLAIDPVETKETVETAPSDTRQKCCVYVRFIGTVLLFILLALIIYFWQNIVLIMYPASSKLKGKNVGNYFFKYYFYFIC